MMKKMMIGAIALLLGVAFLEAKPVERKQLFDSNWQFSLEDTTSWRSVTLPHDWSVEGDFDKNTPAGNDGAYLPTGRGYYRKTFTLGSEYEGKRLRLYFEGVYMNAQVYVNGHLAGGHPYGYSSFYVDITPYAKIGKPNQLEVRVDNSQQKNCRWYSGSGIYRHVWLYTTGQRYIDEWSVQVSTPDMHTAIIKGEVVMEDGTRKPIQKTVNEVSPQLWSPDSPHLYTTTLQAEGDEVPVTYGLRTIEYSAGKGLLLNGKEIRLNGGCLHHDNGMLGAAAFDAAEYRKARLMKEAGFNAVRTSHNPPSEAFLRACDELGLLVIDEAFDGWREQKNAFDYHLLIDQWWQEDIRAMVCRDRCHPSIFCWSIGNEVIERKKIEIVKTAHNMVQLCHQLDPGRPVTSALAAWDPEWDIYDPLAAEHDIVGYNYMIHKSQGDHERVPSRVMMQTESYPRDAWQNYLKVQNEPWVVGDFVWTAIDYLGESGIGRFYYERLRVGDELSGMGEVPGESWERPLFPWHAAYCGDIDLTGLRKPISHYRATLWSPEKRLYLAVREPDGYKGKVKTTMWGTWPTFECWNWPGHEGKDIDVEVYSRYPKVRLYLNDQLVAEQETKDCKATFTLPYQSGTLRAEAVADGQTQTSVTLQTAGEAKTLRLTADHTTLKANGQDLAFITIEALDAQGRPNPIADNLLKASVKGPATLQALGNADIKDCDRYTNASHHLWKGRALLVVRAAEKRGNVQVSVASEGMKTATLRLKTE